MRWKTQSITVFCGTVEKGKRQSSRRGKLQIRGSAAARGLQVTTYNGQGTSDEGSRSVSRSPLFKVLPCRGGCRKRFPARNKYHLPGLQRVTGVPELLLKMNQGLANFLYYGLASLRPHFPPEQTRQTKYLDTADSKRCFYPESDTCT